MKPNFFAVEIPATTGAKYLSDKLPKWQRSAGQFLAILPPDTTVDRHRILDPSLAGIGSGHSKHDPLAIARQLADLISSRLQHGEVAYFHDPFSEGAGRDRIDPSLTELGGKFFKVVDGPSDTNRLVGLLIKYTAAWGFLLVMVPSSFKAASLSELLRTASMLAVDAFDGETYVVWTRTP